MAPFCLDTATSPLVAPYNAYSTSPGLTILAEDDSYPFSVRKSSVDSAAISADLIKGIDPP